MYNFLNSKLSPKINTDVSTMDNYEANNLINEDILIRSRGFLAYTSIKPPVDINFELICPINIHYVLLLTKIGSQKSTGIEILAKTINSEFISIGKAFYNNDGVVFCNSRKYSKKNLPPNCDGYYIAYFRSNLFRIFTNTSLIKIRITHTEKSVPCLGKIEIWGEVSKMCSQITKNTIDQIMNRQKDNIKCQTIPNVKNELSDNFTIPDDFKDAITYEIMSIPMTLPSGHTVDQTTLEKHVETEATYGRQATDPFTGLYFNETRRPVLNVALKSRIDLFLLQNSEQPETFSVKRTLGRKQEASNYFNIEKVKFNNEIENSSSKKFKLDDLPEDPEARLEHAIKTTMNSKTFVRFTEDDKVENLKACVLCNVDNRLYNLPCKHLYCHSCLTETCKDMKCKKCDSKFSKNDPSRIHF